MAFRNGTYREAIQFFSQAFEKAETGKDVNVSTLKHAFWLRRMGEAHMGLGEMDSAREDFRKAVLLLKYSSPTTALGVVFGLIAQSFIKACIAVSPMFSLGV
jgi:tetratricopeptide (TPR) repeat protein